MDIHYSENNLGNIDNNIEKSSPTNDILNDLIVDLNPYAVNNTPIHYTIPNDITMTNENMHDTEYIPHEDDTQNIQEQQYKKNANIRQQLTSDRRNYIMRSVTSERFIQSNKLKIKQLIAASKKQKIKVKPMYNLYRHTPEPVNYTNIINNVPTQKISCDYEYVKPISLVENKKEVNLGEIVTGVLQDVLTKKITNIENVIGKLRIYYEEKNVFANVKKRNIILLNFEDDTMRPVLKIDDKYLDIIQKWYEDCDLFLDIEETNVSIPENITSQDVNNVLFQDLNYKYKEEYLNNYMPLVINNIISNRNIKDFERKYFIKPTKDIKTTYVNQDTDTSLKCDNINDKLLQLGISIPNNINSSYVEEEKKDDNIKKYAWYSDVSGSINPEILNKYILDNPHISNNVVTFDVEPYNSYFEFDTEKSKFDTETSKFYTVKNLYAYNSGYNSLSCKFSDNCEVLDDPHTKEQEIRTDSIFVLIHDKYLQTITIKNPDQNINYIIKNHPEFGFIKLFDYSTDNKDIIEFIEREFDGSMFNVIEEVNKKLLVTSQYIDFLNKQNKNNIIASTEENQVKKFLDSKYTIINDASKKMKASVLYDIIINSKYIKIDSNKFAGFRTRLSKYLKDLGLQKKRYNDGFYYYGIVEKTFQFDNNSNTDKSKISFNLEDIIKNRDEEYLQIIKTPDLGAKLEYVVFDG
jgi:hypothetical protein